MTELPQHFANRREAGRLLSEAVKDRALHSPIVLALPRGGVPVGYEVAKAISAPLDVLLVRKIGAPGHEEYGIGALVGGASPQIVVDEQVARLAGADKDYINRIVARELEEIKRRRIAYHVGAPVVPRGRTAIVIDDGVATGNTAKAALHALSNVGAERIVLAIPVAPRDTILPLRVLCDEVICLATPEPFNAVGAHYKDFTQTTDDEVIRLLAEARPPSDSLH